MTYVALRDRLDDVLRALAHHARRHSKEHFYAVRKERPEDPAALAARLIYLNRTCYNGLWRENSKGEFNVPLGRYKNPRILDDANLRAVSQTLQGVTILCDDFEEVTRDCGAGDLVYLDPPYHPLSTTSYFTSYTSSGFGPEDQRRLARTFERLSAGGAHVLLSNSDSPFIRDLYESARPRPVIDRVEVPRAINSKPRARQPIAELLVSFA